MQEILPPDSPLPLVLGTAQLGMNYGVANRKGRPSLDEAAEIVQAAWESGIRFFDTAQAYGESERVLGHCLKKLGLCQDAQLRINTKLDPGTCLSDEGAIRDRVAHSLKELGVERLWCIMLHRESLLNEPLEVFRHVALRLKAEGKVEHFGVSIYSAEKAFDAFALEGLDAVQLPFNVFDQRALEWNLFEYAAAHRKHLLVRSIYLQGLLLMDSNQLPPALSFSRELIDAFHAFAGKERVAPKLLSLGFVSQTAPGALILFGAETSEQVRENVWLYRAAAALELPDMSFLSSRDLRLINPSNWPN